MLQLASMVGVPERHERFEPQYQQQQHLAQHPMRTQDSRAHPNSSVMSTPYSMGQQRRFEYSYSTPTSQQAPVSPPSPPGDEANKPSLPSISSLLGMADVNKQGEQQHQLQPEQQQQNAAAPMPEYNSDALAQSYGSTVNSRISLPPTPPLVPDSHIDGNQSPSTVSTHSTISAPHNYYLSHTVGNVETHHRQSFSEHAGPKRLSITSQPGISSYPATQYTTSAYLPTPPMPSVPYYSEGHVLPSSGMYAQRPLPSNFPPPVSLTLANPAPGGGANPWQHHHYISPSSQASFPQSQDRYVCPTCNKAFSRPSSLRIHSHSHTGEKPFKCSHVGCGKAFSVRSNMKRHERGCHAGNNSAMASS